MLTVDNDGDDDQRLCVAFDRLMMWVLGEVGRRRDVRYHHSAELEGETVRPPDRQMTGAAFGRLRHSSTTMILTQTDRINHSRRLHIAAKCLL